MAFFSDLGKKVSLAAQEVARQAKESASVSKQENLIAEERKTIKTLCQQIGEKYYALYGDSCDESFADLVSQIKECEARIAMCLEEIDHIKGVKKCPQCDSEITVDAKFCKSCGFRMEGDGIPEAATVENGVACGNCGFTITDGAPFCENCGTPVSKEQETTETTAGRICKNCGEDVGEDAFCQNCGAKVE